MAGILIKRGNLNKDTCMRTPMGIGTMFLETKGLHKAKRSPEEILTYKYKLD